MSPGCCTSTVGPATPADASSAASSRRCSLSSTFVRTRRIPSSGPASGYRQATAWRYVDETLDVLASWASGLQEALTGLGEGDHVIVDGTLSPTGRIRADEPYHSQKHRKHGLNVQVIAASDGIPLWFSRATPGRTHSHEGVS